MIKTHNECSFYVTNIKVDDGTNDDVDHVCDTANH